MNRYSPKPWIPPPANYVGKHWYGWYAFLNQNRDSDALERANFATAFNAVCLASKFGNLPDSDTELEPRVVRENHWAVGWVEWIAIHPSDLEALKCAEDLAEQLEQYPCLDESAWSALEDEEKGE